MMYKYIYICWLVIAVCMFTVGMITYNATGMWTWIIFSGLWAGAAGFIFALILGDYDDDDDFRY